MSACPALRGFRRVGILTPRESLDSGRVPSLSRAFLLSSVARPAPLGREFSAGGRTLTVGRIPARSLSAPKLMRFAKALQSPRHGRGYVRNRAEVSDWMNIPAQAKLELIG